MSQTTEMTAAQLREALIGDIEQNRADIKKSVSAEILNAIRSVPRHVFMAGVSLEEAYDNSASPVMKRDESGTIISSVSAPYLQAAMLEQADITPGMRVLEIGSGGYNAALISHLVGDTGHVVTLDIDHDVCDRASKALSATGYDNVTVICADGEYGAPDFAPFNRIIVTVSAPDIPPAWIDQLVSNGRLIVPLRTRSLARSYILERHGSHLVSSGYELCGFVPIQGAAEARQRRVSLVKDTDDVVLRVDDSQPVEELALQQALTEQPRCEAWSSVTVGPMEPWDDLDMYLATRCREFGSLIATKQARQNGIVSMPLPRGMSATWDRDSLAYLTQREVDPKLRIFEFGAYAHGPNAQVLANRLVSHVRSWGRDYRDDPFHLEVHPATALDGDLPTGLVVDKPHSRVTISWPPHL